MNSVVPRSRSYLPQSGHDAERQSGEPGVALLAGVRGENSPRAPYLRVQQKNRRDREIGCAQWPDSSKRENCGAEFGNCRTEPESFGRFFRRGLRQSLCVLECAAQAVQRSPHSMTEGFRSEALALA